MMSKKLALTPGGEGFLKCAFAPPDFAFDNGNGVPDEFDGRVLIRRQNYLQQFVTVPGRDTYILQLPTPGCTYWNGTVLAGSIITPANPLVLAPFVIPDFVQNFPGTVEGSIFPEFRYVSQAMELTSLQNEMTWVGSAIAFKMPITLTTVSSGLINEFAALALNGFNNISSAVSQGTADTYVGTSRAGVYMVATNKQPDWRFTPIAENAQVALSVAGLPGGVGQPLYLATNFVGLGNLETNVVIIPATATTQTFVIRTWACIEYKVSIGSSLYEYSRTSATYDPVALHTYRRMAHAIAIAVPACQNATFWENLLRVVQAGFGGISNVVPGPLGMIAGGISGVARGLLAGFYE